MLTKKAYTLEELMLYLEALEMLDMVYTIKKYPELRDGEDVLSAFWIIEYTQGEPSEQSAPIYFED
jgi:hypothetical protein